MYPTKVVLGQRSDNQTYGIRPSYVMIKAGAWGEDAVQINNFYPAKELVNKRNKLDFQIGSCILSEHTISGAVSVDKEEALRYPECMTDAGSMSWNLQVNKKIPYCVGYGTSWFFRFFHFFQMYWHAQGVKTEYSGKVTLNGSVYNVLPESCYGYADKNWGVDFTNPWVWLSSCDVTSLITGKKLENSCFELGGGTPRVLGIPVKGKVLTYLKLEDEEFEFNFSKNHFIYTFSPLSQVITIRLDSDKSNNCALFKWNSMPGLSKICLIVYVHTMSFFLGDDTCSPATK